MNSAGSDNFIAHEVISEIMSYSIIIFALFLIACLFHLKKVLEFLISLLGLKDLFFARLKEKNYSDSLLLIRHCSEIMKGILSYNDPNIKVGFLLTMKRHRPSFFIGIKNLLIKSAQWLRRVLLLDLRQESHRS